MKLEYLIPIDSKKSNLSTVETFKHNLQVIDEIKIHKNFMVFKNTIQFPFNISKGEISSTKHIFFELKIEIDEANDLKEVHEFIRKLKSILFNISPNMQILYDGVSKFYSVKAYPLIYEVENLMRKLITKFMIANVGVDWIKNEVPDDLKNGIRTPNRDKTFLYNFDFIQLKSLLFSEKYNRNKEELISKIKSIKKESEIDIEELKSLLPTSNWEKYFSKKLKISSKDLSDKWQELYDLRCLIAHNRTFSKDNYDIVEKLVEEIKPHISSAIKNLDEVKVESIDFNDLIQDVILQLDNAAFIFIKKFQALMNKVNKRLDSIDVQKIYGHTLEDLNFQHRMGILLNDGIINENDVQDLVFLDSIYMRTFGSQRSPINENELKKSFQLIDRFEDIFSL
jgi:hypothetical protein